MLLGNDIVDRAATSGHNPRFIDRILNPTEKSRAVRWSLDEALIWAYWAAKEAAYKALRQGLDIPFHHREFTVSPDLTSVQYRQHTLRLLVQPFQDALFAVATDGDPALCRSRLFAFSEEPSPSVLSRKARELLLELAAETLRLPESALSIVMEGRIPRLSQGQQRLASPVSLTHHGRYVAASVAAGSASQS